MKVRHYFSDKEPKPNRLIVVYFDISNIGPEPMIGKWSKGTDFPLSCMVGYDVERMNPCGGDSWHYLESTTI